jgi:hypothetical protein
LNDVLDRINASGAEATASLDDESQRVIIVSDEPSSALVLGSGGTNFFSVLDISEGTYRPTQASGSRKGISQSRASQIAEAIEDLAKTLNVLFNETNSTYTDASLVQLRIDIRIGISESFESEGTQFKTKFGVNFDIGDTAKRIFAFSLSDRAKLISALTNKNQIRDVSNLFFGVESMEEDGLVERLVSVLKRAESNLKDRFRSPGLGLNLRV